MSTLFFIRPGLTMFRVSVAVIGVITSASIGAQDGQNLQHAQHAQHAHRHGQGIDTPAPLFIASTAKPFAALMDDAMAVMDDGMKRAPVTGMPEHDFMTMMIPHHQGAIDMAKAVLLNTSDPEVRNLAQGIITEQQNEIRLMQAWLERLQQKPRQ